MPEPDAIVRHEADGQRYVLEIGGEEKGAADYEKRGEQLVFNHTVVDPDLKGQGMGSLLIKEALSDAQARNLRIVPECEFVAAYLKRHPEWNDSVDWPE